MKVQDLMTRNVRTLGPDMTLKDAAALLAEHRIGGMPVVDASGMPLGVMSKTDILIKERAKVPRKGWLRRFGRSEADNVEAKVSAHTVGEAMSAPPVTIAPETSVSIAADRMMSCGVNRLPVVQHDRVVGIITRHDLVRVFARGDFEIEREIREETFEGLTWPEAIAVEVKGGDVKLRGRADSVADARLLPAQVRQVLGVVSVDSELSAWDQSAEKQVLVSESL
jgi:CBS domain-containing protein